MTNSVTLILRKLDATSSHGVARDVKLVRKIF